MSVLDYGDILYCHVAPTTLQHLNAMYHSALRFITNDKFHTYHCSLYHTVGRTSLQTRRNSHLMLLIYNALLLKLPNDLTSLLTLKSRNYNTRSSNYLTLDIPHHHPNVATMQLLNGMKYKPLSNCRLTFLLGILNCNYLMSSLILATVFFNYLSMFVCVADCVLVNVFLFSGLSCKRDF